MDCLNSQIQVHQYFDLYEQHQTRALGAEFFEFAILLNYRSLEIPASLLFLYSKVAALKSRYS